MLGETVMQLKFRLAVLVDRGLVREVGTGTKDPQCRYHLTESL